MKSTSIVLANNHHEYTSNIKSPSYRKHPSNRQIKDDDDWIMQTPKRRPTRSFSEKKTAPTSVGESDVNRIIRSVAEETSSPQMIESPLKTDTKNAFKLGEAKVVTGSIGNAINTTPKSKVDENSHTKCPSMMKRDNEKKKQIQVRQNVYLKLLWITLTFEY